MGPVCCRYEHYQDELAFALVASVGEYVLIMFYLLQLVTKALSLIPRRGRRLISRAALAAVRELFIPSAVMLLVTVAFLTLMTVDARELAAICCMHVSLFVLGAIRCGQYYYSPRCQEVE